MGKEKMTRFPPSIFRALALATFAVPALLAQPVAAIQSAVDPDISNLSGAYLAARTADVEKDVENAARFYREALKGDPANLLLLERAMVLSASSGNMVEALSLAEKLKSAAPDNHPARLLLAIEDIRAGRNQQAIETLGEGNSGVLAELTSALLRAWATFGAGDVDKALKDLAALEGETWYKPFKLLHGGYISFAAGRTEDAIKSFKEALSEDGNAVRITEAYARALATAGQTDEAIATLEEFLVRFPDNALAWSALKDIRAGTGAGATVSTAAKGAAEALAGVGAAVGQEGGTEVAYLYLGLSLYLDAKIAGGLAALSLGDLLDAGGQGEAAIEAFESITPDLAFHALGQLRAALALDRMEKTEESIEAFKTAVASDPKEVQTYILYGNVLRSRERYAEAAEVYSEAVDLVSEPGPADWSIFYFRGICFERTKQWDKAEADFRKALELSPDQPLVLNYLGYSWIDMGINLDEGMEMIRKAVELRPNDGYIVDSLGWAHYRLGEYDEAVTELERAITLKPDDPVINDHLGDAYWKMGRQLEAQFQWRHARDFGAEDETLDLILKKIAERRLIEPEPVEDEKKADMQKDATLYTVRPGDSLWTISATLLKSGGSYGKILDANKDKLSSPDQIFPGMQLLIPGDI
jgi:tetratricopeptide (TPR) repeat protein